MDLNSTDKQIIAIDRRALNNYMDLFYFEMGLCTFGISILVYLIFGKWYSKAYVKNYSVELENGYLKVNKGIFFKSRKSIPMDKITDFVWEQGPIMKLNKVYAIRIDTASSNIEMAEASIVAPIKKDLIEDLEEYRNQYMQKNK